MKALKKVAAALALGIASATVSASPWIDTVTWSGEGRLVNFLSPLHYTHTITDDGYVPGTALSGLGLAITFADDERDGIFHLHTEYAYVLPEDVGLLNGFLSGEIAGEPTLDLVFDSGAAATLALVDDGALGVWITISLLQNPIGDFFVRQSVLTATAATASVPEPGALALLAAGMVGAGVVARRRKPAR